MERQYALKKGYALIWHIATPTNVWVDTRPTSASASWLDRLSTLAFIAAVQDD